MPQTARVLVADHDPVQRAIVAGMLDLAGFDCEEALDGEAALQALACRPADVVVLEMLMPNKDGIEVLIHIKREWPDTKVLTISAGGLMSPAQLLHLSRALGADATMAKPLRRGAFVAAVRDLAGRSPRAAAEPAGAASDAAWP
ncbi:response regulator [Phenylobacterium terrae]|uniref:Response regulator n=1 Tax=Phenylobacterium terrae TaxID=2665495 RepID=A0ABW4MZN2_9CAUL